MKKVLRYAPVVLVVLAVSAAGVYRAMRKHPAPAAVPPSTVVVANDTASDTVVFFSFGADSSVLPSDWPFCTASAKLNCSFTLRSREAKDLPTGGRYLNATVSFGSPVGCGTTKAELNVNNPKWYDTLDVSLVDGFSNSVLVDVNGTKLGPPAGATGNEKVLGVYPLGCDICVARQKPPCGQKPGNDGCKKGPDQYHPDVPCQYQGPSMGGGSTVRVSLAASAVPSSVH